MSLLVCDICERGCRVEEGAAGACGMYRRSGDRMVELHPNRYLVACPISIETMPILHFNPGGKFFQISTIGCNFECPGCISTVIVKEMLPSSRAIRTLSPEAVVEETIGNGCMGIAFLMNDPLASLPTFLKVARSARERGLLVGCSSNTYFTENALQELIGCIDFINVGIKGFSDAAYRACGAPGLDPVVRNLTRLVRAGIHVEISCIHTRENREELQALAQCIAELDRRIPLQVMPSMKTRGAAPVRLVLYLFLSLLSLSTALRHSPVLSREIFDMAGRRVTVPETILSVYGTSPPGTYMMFAMDPNRIAGLNREIDPIQKKYLPEEISALPVVGGWFGQGQTPNPETLMEVKPDIALVWIWKGFAMVDKVEAPLAPLGIPIVYIPWTLLKKFYVGVRRPDVLMDVASPPRRIPASVPGYPPMPG